MEIIVLGFGAFVAGFLAGRNLMWLRAADHMQATATIADVLKDIKKTAILVGPGVTVTRSGSIVSNGVKVTTSFAAECVTVDAQHRRRGK